jgi:hypothetical protein
VAAAVTAAAGVDASRVRVTRLIEEATGWAVALPLAAGARLASGGQPRQLQAPETLLAGPPLGSAQAAAWRYVVAVNLTGPSSSLGGAAPTPLSAASLGDRLASAATAPAWSALATTWAAASGQAPSAVLAQLAVSVSPPPVGGASASAGSGSAHASHAGVIGGSVAGAIACLGLLAACGYAVLVRRRTKLHAGLGLAAPVLVPAVGGAPAGAGAQPHAI